MRLTLFTFFLCIASITFAQSIDVISLKNGSIIHGHIVNYQFDATKYSIKLEDGSVHTFSKSLISKISRAPKKPDTLEKVTIQKTLKAPTKVQLPKVQLAKAQMPNIEHDISIGNLWHTVYNPYKGNDEGLTQAERYNGIKLHYQKNYRKHFALRYGFEYATLDRIELSMNDEVLDTDNDVDRNVYTGLIATVIASTNLQRGWRAYVGAGLYNHHYFNENSKDKNYLGPRFEFGGGYMWQTLSLTLQYNWHSRGQYPSDTDTIFSGGFNLGMAI